MISDGARAVALIGGAPIGTALRYKSSQRRRPGDNNNNNGSMISIKHRDNSELYLGRRFEC